MTEADSKSSALPPATILILGLSAVLLGAYQWYDLVQWRSAGQVPFCTIGVHLDCSRVWDSPLSLQIQRLSGIPVPGWGIAWAAVVTFLAVRLLFGVKRGQALDAPIQALRLTVLVGTAVILGLLVYSIALGTFCLTCIAFYVIVLLIAFFTLRYLRGSADASWGRILANSAVPLMVAFAIMIYPGTRTPLHNALAQPIKSMVKNNAGGPAPSTDKAGATQKNPMASFLSSLPEALQQAISQSLVKYRREPRLAHPVDTGRLVYGTVSAPVHLTEWIDIRCPHCRHMEETLQEIREVTPPGSWSWELHHFPLDGECNPVIRRDAGGISCLAAKILICQSGSPDANTLRDDMFKHQRELTKERLWQMSAKTPEQRTRLKQCVDSSKTREALRNDIQTALQYKIEGTPLIVINGKKATPIPAFIYSLIVAMGRENDPGFNVLPAISKNGTP